jgi:transcriptional regulator with XRE-family HTH domain
MAREVADRFAENLIVWRKSADLSQEELGFLSNLHRTEIGALERGRLPRIDTLLKLAGALEVTPNELLQGMTWKAKHNAPLSGSFAFKE